MTDTHEVRVLRHKLKTLARQNGRQGQAIYELRAQLALTREEHSRIERGELRRLDRADAKQAELLAVISDLREQNMLLRNLAGALREDAVATATTVHLPDLPEPGLGKTLQVLAALVESRNATRSQPQPF